MCEGLRCCREAISRKPDWIEFGVRSENFELSELPESTVEFESVAAVEFQEMSQTENPQGVLLVLRKPISQSSRPLTDAVIPVLDRLADPGNVGTILRGCWAMGFETVVWTSGTVHPLNAKAIRAGMGAQFALNLVRIDDLDELHALSPDSDIWVTRPQAKISCLDDAFTAKGFIVLGNEANGAGSVVGSRDVSIPMPGHAESLNVAQAATIMLYEVVRRNFED